MAKKKTTKKVAKKATKKASKTIAKKTTKKQVKKEKPLITEKDIKIISNKRVVWWLFGRLLLLAVIVYGILYMMFRDFTQGSAIILGAFAVWLLVIIINYLRKNR